LKTLFSLDLGKWISGRCWNRCPRSWWREYDL